MCVKLTLRDFNLALAPSPHTLQTLILVEWLPYLIYDGWNGLSKRYIYIYICSTWIMGETKDLDQISSLSKACKIEKCIFKIKNPTYKSCLLGQKMDRDILDTSFNCLTLSILITPSAPNHLLPLSKNSQQPPPPQPQMHNKQIFF